MELLDHFKAALAVHWHPKRGHRPHRIWAERQLEATVKSAYRQVPYYREAFDRAGIDIANFSAADLGKLPFFTKNELQANFPAKLVADGTQLDRCKHSATTGSSGKAVNFVFHPRTYAYYLATSLRVYTMIGYRPWHKIVYIKYTQVSTPKVGFGKFFRVAHIPSMIPVQEQIRRLREEKPDLLVGYASIILDVARNVTPADLADIRPRFVSVNSEMSTQAQRDFIASVFDCPVYDEYSTEETWMVASQCPHGSYHLFTDNVWVEFLDPQGNEVAPGEVGEIVLTTLRSPAMPFIRYRIGDLGRKGEGPCACGSAFPVLKAFDGRADDAFVLPSGGRLPSLKLLNAFTTFIKSDPGLMREFRLVQEKVDQVLVKLVKGPEFAEERVQKLLQRLQEVIREPVTMRVEYFDSLDREGRIKQKAITSLVGKPLPAAEVA